MNPLRKYVKHLTLLAVIFLITCSDEPESQNDSKADKSGENYNQNDVSDASSSDYFAEIDNQCAKIGDDSPDTLNLTEDFQVSQMPPIKTIDVKFVGPLGEKYQSMPPNCIDNDGDYYGKYCGWGDDCDDNNPNFNTYCPDCTKQNYKGCPCLSAKTTCFTHDLNLVGVGICQTGIQACKGGFWKECVGEIPPENETCDSLDNDCDGSVDEGVKSTCDNCDFGCFRQTIAPKTDNPFVISEYSKNVKYDKNGNITTKAVKQVPIKFGFIWIANSNENTVSKLDTKTGNEVGRYKVCSDPSRTAVDLVGDVWVGCRDNGGIIKIIGNKNKCVDKNKNGKIDTAEDKNKNKKIEANEMLPYLKDECIKFEVFPEGKGNWNTVPRAAGVDKDNYAWIGFYYLDKLVKLHPQTGKTVDNISLGCSPYGLAIDKGGIIWISGRGCGSLLRVDPKTKKVDKIAFDKGSPYGMSIDSLGNIWLADTGSHTSQYNPLTKKWTHIKHGLWSRGVASSNTGHVYVALDTASAVAKININTLKLEKEISIGNGKYPVGIAVDHDGFIWAINQGSNSATKINPKTDTVVGEYPVGLNPYTYSDMTGYALLNYTLPSGYYVHSFGLFIAKYYVAESKSVKKWEFIDVKGQFPKGAYVLVYYRAGYTPNGMEKTAWTGPFGPIPPEKMPIDLTKENVLGFYMQVKIVMQANQDKKSPIIEKIIVQSHVVN